MLFGWKENGIILDDKTRDIIVLTVSKFEHLHPISSDYNLANKVEIDPVW